MDSRASGERMFISVLQETVYVQITFTSTTRSTRYEATTIDTQLYVVFCTELLDVCTP